MTSRADGPSLRRRHKMTNPHAAATEATRQRKLDDLFGDEPFLSPTMKARRLHEPPVGEPSYPHTGAAEPTTARARSSCPGLIPEVSDDEVAALWRRRTALEPHLEDAPERETAAVSRRGVSFSGVHTVTPNEKSPHDPHGPAIRLEIRSDPDDLASGAPVPFAKAAAVLRGGCLSATPEGSETMRRFRCDVLYGWLKKVPARDVDGMEIY